MDYKVNGSAEMTDTSLVRACGVIARRGASPSLNMVRESSVTLVSGACCDKQTLLFITDKVAFTTPGEFGLSNAQDWVLDRNRPIALRDVENRGQQRELMLYGFRSRLFQPLVSIGCEV